MRIARVFARKTSFSPTDKDAYFDAPDMFTPIYDCVHISAVFTWDRDRAEQLRRAWINQAEYVFMGGPAWDNQAGEFEPGMYLRHGITITSRGCPNKCDFCLVPEREGSLRELEVKEGNIIQDNNILACSRGHLEKVFTMLKTQKAIEFKGGLEARRVTPEIADQLRGLRIKTLWLACDSRGALKPFQGAVEILHNAGFTRNHIYSYVLIGKDRDEEEQRLREVYGMGAMPFAQLYQPADKLIEYSKEWKRFARTWSRPAAYKTLIKEGGEGDDSTWSI